MATSLVFDVVILSFEYHWQMHLYLADWRFRKSDLLFHRLSCSLWPMELHSFLELSTCWWPALISRMILRGDTECNCRRWLKFQGKMVRITGGISIENERHRRKHGQQIRYINQHGTNYDTTESIKKDLFASFWMEQKRHQYHEAEKKSWTYYNCLLHSRSSL